MPASRSVTRAVGAVLDLAPRRGEVSLTRLVDAVSEDRGRPIELKMADLPPGVCGQWRQYADRDVFLIQKGLPAWDRTLAHELGHLVLGHEGIPVVQAARDNTEMASSDLIGYMLNQRTGCMGPNGEDAGAGGRGFRGPAAVPVGPVALRSRLHRPGSARRGVWLIIWVIAGLLGLATGLRIGWALVNKQSLVSTAMILALGSLGLVAALNWQPLTLLIDTVLRWPNISMGLSQVALIACAAGSCVMITTVASGRKPATIRKIAIAQYSVAGVIAVVSLVAFFSAGQQPEMSPEEYLRRNLAPAAIRCRGCCRCCTCCWR